jgi:hypothetical protein
LVTNTIEVPADVTGTTDPRHIACDADATDPVALPFVICANMRETLLID